MDVPRSTRPGLDRKRVEGEDERKGGKEKEVWSGAMFNYRGPWLYLYVRALALLSSPVLCLSRRPLRRFTHSALCDRDTVLLSCGELREPPQFTGCLMSSRAQSWFITGDQAPGKTLRRKNKGLTSMGNHLQTSCRLTEVEILIFPNRLKS